MKRIVLLGSQITQLLLRTAHSQVVSGMVLILATAIALILANTPGFPWIHPFFERSFTVHLFHHSALLSLRSIVNEGGMTLFFLLVGMEIKREFLFGELASFRKATLPVIAALGGMLIPATIYLGFCYGTPFAKGWGIPIATDIAFAGGILALFGKRIPLWAKVYLTSLAIVDDIGSVLVIAVFYTDSLSWWALAIAAALTLAMFLFRCLGVKKTWVYLALGIPLWVAVLYSGVHATLAGLVVAFLLPQNHSLTNSSLPRQVESTEPFLAPLFERRLHLLVTFVVLPLFALCNAAIALPGANLGSAFHHPIAQAILFGLVLGKPIGVFSFTWFATKLNLAQLPQGASWIQVLGLALLAGIGFTMSMFIAHLSFPSNGLQEVAKIGILLGSSIATLGGVSVLLGSRFRSKRNLSTPSFD